VCKKKHARVIAERDSNLIRSIQCLGFAMFAHPFISRPNSSVSPLSNKPRDDSSSRELHGKQVDGDAAISRRNCKSHKSFGPRREMVKLYTQQQQRSSGAILR
jgi:hypothetical protein